MTKTSNFTRIIHLNWLAKFELSGPEFPGRQYIVNYCYARVLLYAKMLKESETEEARRFCYLFLIGEISIGEGGGPLLSSWLHLWCISHDC